MKKMAVILTALAVLLAGGVSESAAAGNAFKDISSFTADKQFRVVLAFEAAPKTIVKYYEKSIQIDVPNGLVKPGKREFSVNHAGIKDINLYQVRPDLMRIRIFPSESVEKLKNEFSMEKNAEKLVFAIGPKTVAASTNPAAAAPEASKIPAPAEVPAASAEPAEADIVRAAGAETTKIADTVSPEDAALIANLQESLNNLKRESDPAGQNGDGAVKQAGMLGADSAALPQAPSLGEAFVKIGSALAIVLALILVISFGVKKYLGAVEGGLGTKKQLKILSNHFIGVKKNVTIIEVGGEILVLGVTNSNITLLSRYSDPEKIEEIRHSHRLPDKPLGVFKKFPFMAWLERRRVQNKPVNPAFARQIASYEETMKTAAPVAETGNGIQTRKDEMVDNITRTIAGKLRSLQGSAG